MLTCSQASNKHYCVIFKINIKTEMIKYLSLGNTDNLLCYDIIISRILLTFGFLFHFSVIFNFNFLFYTNFIAILVSAKLNERIRSSDNPLYLYIHLFLNFQFLCTFMILMNFIWVSWPLFMVFTGAMLTVCTRVGHYAQPLTFSIYPIFDYINVLLKLSLLVSVRNYICLIL